jgi:stress response protein YsnF
MTDVDDVTAGTDPATTDRAMTRSEERLKVGVQARPITRAVLRKYIVVEEVTRTFTVRREEVRLEQIAVSDADITASASAAFEREEYEVILHEERPVISTEVVPVERVRLVKEVVTEYVAVSDQLRKERIDLDVDRPSR